MTSRTCKTCKYWWPNKSKQNMSMKLDPKYPDGVHWGCTNKLLSLRISTSDEPSGLSSYEEVETGPDFGCIHWEKAEHGNLTSSPQKVK